CGQFPESKGNSIYNLTFLDDYTHWCWVTTIPDKTSATVQNAFSDLIKQIETETELKIKYLRTDGGGEYQGDLTPLLKEMGIKHIHVPEQRRKSLNKVDSRSTRGCFIGYLDTPKMHKIWDFERKCFVNSHDVIFEETQFPKPSDFDEIPADPYIPSPERPPET